MERRFGLIGFPLDHSRSATYFNQRFSSAGITNARYELFPLPSLAEIHQLLQRIPALEGLNVTIPYKEQILPLLSGVDDLAATIGSVNVVLIEHQDGIPKLTGYNTDAGGFLASLPGKEHHRRALVLGTGGAAKAIAYALSLTGTGVTFVSRNPRHPLTLSYKQLWDDPEVIGTHTLIVNATPVGMYPDTGTFPNIPYHLLGPRHLLYDLVYNPQQTVFLLKGETNGAQTQSGENLFLAQADLSYKLFIK